MAAPRGIPQDRSADTLTPSIERNLADAFGRRIFIRLEPDSDWVFRITHISDTESPVLPSETVAGTPFVSILADGDKATVSEALLETASGDRKPRLLSVRVPTGGAGFCKVGLVGTDRGHGVDCFIETPRETATIPGAADLPRVLESNKVSYILVDRTYEVVDFNPLANRYVELFVDSPLRVGVPIEEQLPRESREKTLRRIADAFGGRESGFEELRRSAMRTYYFDTRYTPVYQGESSAKYVAISFRDETAAREQEGERETLLHALESSPISVLITDREGTITYANDFFLHTSGYERDELIGENPRILNSGRDDREKYRDLWETVLAGRRWYGNFENRRKNGTRYWERAVLTPVLDDDGDVSAIIALKLDITEVESAREDLEQSLREQQTLLQELHHRVQNNLQTVASLVRLQLDEVVDDRDRLLLSSYINRIESMATVHQLLYQSESLHEIPIFRYLREMRVYWASATSAAETPPTIRIEGDETAELNIEKAVPLGLVLNELVKLIVDAQGEADSAIEIVLKLETEEGVTIHIAAYADLPEARQLLEEPRSRFSRELIEILIEQLRGTLLPKAGPGLAAELSLPVEAPAN